MSINQHRRGDLLREAAEKLQESIRLLDEAGAPAEIAARVDHALHQLQRVTSEARPED